MEYKKIEVGINLGSQTEAERGTEENKVYQYIYKDAMMRPVTMYDNPKH